MSKQWSAEKLGHDADQACREIDRVLARFDEDTRNAIVLRIVACDLGPERMAQAGRLLNPQHANEVMASLFGREVVDRKFKKVRAR